MVVTNYVWDVVNDSYLMETDENDVTQMVYTNRPDTYGELISQRRNTGGSWSIVYYHFDGLGSTSNISDINEYVPETYIYDAFGNVLSSNSFTPNFLWIGQLGYYWDSILADYYIRARHYNPAIARWLSQDPIGFFSGVANLFQYVGNDPTNLSDPTGLRALTEEAKRAFCDYAGTVPEIREHAPGEPSTGGVICVSGELVSCSWQEAVGDKEVDDIHYRCIIAHEDTHHDGQRDCVGNCIYRAIPKPGMDRNESECKAYLAERACYEMALWFDECQTESCRTPIGALITHINTWAKAEYKCSGPGWADDPHLPVSIRR